MASKSNATYQQSNFLGGEWSPQAQGRSDDPRYKTAVGAMGNAMPTEQGAWTRRGGTQGVIPTRNRNYARLLPLETASSLPYVMEFTDNSLRFLFGGSPCFTNDPRTILSNSGSTLTLDAAHGYSIGDDFMVWFPIDFPVANEGGWRNMVLQAISGTTGSTLVLGDETGISDLQGTPTFDGNEFVFRIQRLDTTGAGIAGQSVLQGLRVVQADNSGIILQRSVVPQQVTITTQASGPADPVFAIAAVAFTDGPFGAIETGSPTGTVSAFSGTLTFTPTTGSPFTAADVGKQIRLFSEPPTWASGTTYANGALVKYNGAYYQSTQASNTGNFPGTPSLSGGVLVTWWVPALNVQRWVWGTISAQASTSCTVILGADLSGVGGATNVIPSGNGSTITQWQRGLYAAGNYPTCGVFHEGRLFLAGATTNRYDASSTLGINQFNLTDQYGNVNDDCAISETLQSSEEFRWMRSDDRGVVAGAEKGEYLISAGVEGQAMTPTNSKARRVTEYKCAFIDPVKTGSSVVFAQRYKKHLYEYLIDSFSGRFGGKPLNDMDMPLTEGDIAELALTEEPTPTVWMRMADLSLATCTYRRISRFITEAPLFNAMAPHSVGDGRVVEAICGVANPGGGDQACAVLADPTVITSDITANGDFLYLVSNDAPDPATGSMTNNRMIEVLRPQAEGDDFSLSWYADQAPGTGKHIVGTTIAVSDVVCTSFGGIAGSDSQTTEPADIGQRATGTPSFSNTPGAATRTVALAPFGDAVYFNGYSALHDLPKIQNPTGFTLSVWLNIDGFNSAGGTSPNTGPSASTSNGPCAQGVILGGDPVYKFTPAATVNYLPLWNTEKIYETDFGTTPNPATGRTAKITGPAFDSTGAQWLAAGQVRYCKVTIVPPKYTKQSSNPSPQFTGFNLTPMIPVTGGTSSGFPVFFGTVASADLGAMCPPSAPSSGFYGWNGTDFIIFDRLDTQNAPYAALDEGWFNLLISVTKISGNNYTTLMYVNDTLIENSTQAYFGGIPFANLTQFAIGGRVGAARGAGGPGNNTMQSSLPSDGTGLVAAMTEFWIAPVGLDLTLSATRALFHVTDVAGLTYAPADLGAQGKTPTGSKPWVYCTGGPKVFHINRAKKNAALAVYNQFPDVDHQVANALDNQIYLDAYQPGPPS